MLLQDQGQLEAAKKAIEEAMGSGLEVRSSFLQEGAVGMGTIGLWFDTDSRLHAERQLGVDRIRILGALGGGSTFAVRIDGAFVLARIDSAIRTLVPQFGLELKQLYHGYLPDGLYVHVDVEKSLPVLSNPTGSFEVRLRVKPENGQLVFRVETDVNVDIGSTNRFLLGVVKLFDVATSGMISAIWFEHLWDLETWAEESAEGEIAGVEISQWLPIPGSIPIPGGKKLEITWNNIGFGVDSVAGPVRGIIAQGTIEIESREPNVEIRAARNLFALADSGRTIAELRVGLDTQDLRRGDLKRRRQPADGFALPPSKNKLWVRWTAPGDLLEQGAEETTIRFELAGVRVGDVITRRIQVHVRDADDRSASAEHVVSIHVVDRLPHPTPGDFHGPLPGSGK
jgi:hypothetical protein